MKGYKALNQDMKAILGNEMQFELGKTYSINGELVPCKNGFHFCEKIEYLNCCYDIANSRIFEVETDGIIKQCGNKYAAERIKLVRELSKEEISKYFEQNLQSLVYHNEVFVRLAVAKQGYGLDVLVYDEDYNIREVIAKQGYGFNVLVHDEDYNIREIVAK